MNQLDSAEGNSAENGLLDEGAVEVGSTDLEVRRTGRATAVTRRAWRIRIAGLAVAVGLLIPLITARTLQPSVSGLGTHQQLGLPPCSIRVFFGIRCPACGMTTSWSHFTRGQITASFAANIGGLGLAILAVSVVGVSFASVCIGKMPSAAIGRNLSIAVVAIGIITIGEWLYRLWRS